MARTDRWALARAEEDGVHVLFRYRADLPVKDTTQFPNLVSILWQYDGDENDGMPDDATLEHMKEVEGALESIDDSGDAFLMVVVTGNDRREWIWYVGDTRKFMSMLNRALRGKPKFPIDLGTSEDPTWLTYFAIREASGRRGSAP